MGYTVGSQLRNRETAAGSDPLGSQCVEGVETLDATTSTWRLRNGAVEGLRNKISMSGHYKYDISAVDHNGWGRSKTKKLLQINLGMNAPFRHRYWLDMYLSNLFDSTLAPAIRSSHCPTLDYCYNNKLSGKLNSIPEIPSHPLYVESDQPMCQHSESPPNL
jgi:hypothetical protein